jgi:hypothetical protein
MPTTTSTASTTTTTASTTTTTTTPPAGGTWASPWGVSPPGWLGSDMPRVSVDRQGDALLVWDALDLSTSNSVREVQARRKPAGGPAEPIVTLDVSGNFPDVDSDDDGDAAVAWNTQGGGAVKGRRIDAAGALVGDVQTLSTSAPTGRPAVAVAPDGTAMVAWDEIRDGSWCTVARQFNADGSIGPAMTLGPSEGSSYPDVGVDRNGQFVVTWIQSPAEAMAARIGPDSVPSTQALTAPIRSESPFGYPQVGVDGDGDAVISYLSGGGGRVQLWASRWGRTGTLDDPVNVSSPTDDSGLLHAIATDLEGDSMLVWTRMRSDSRVEMFGRQLTRTGALGTITSLGEVDYPDIVLDDDGDGLLVFHSPSRRTLIPMELDAHDVGARTISPSGEFGSPVTLTSDGRSPRVAASPSARFTVVWQTAAYPQGIQATEGP